MAVHIVIGLVFLAVWAVVIYKIGWPSDDDFPGGVA